jgi:hypothetical protein
MKCALSFFLLITLSTAGQNPLGFNKRFVESEDKWVAFEMDKDSAYSYGFIYIDPQAGLTFNSEGSFTISSSGC